MGFMVGWMTADDAEAKVLAKVAGWLGGPCPRSRRRRQDLLVATLRKVEAVLLMSIIAMDAWMT